MLGTNVLLTALEAGHEVTATSNTRSMRQPGVEWRKADLTSATAAKALLTNTRPDWVIHCAGATDVDRCEEDPKWAIALNRDTASNVAEGASKARAALVHVSTDAVFDGSPGPHRESDEARPINVYGASKLEGEQVVLEKHPGAAIVRTNFYGWSPPGRLSLAEWFLDKLRAGDPCDGFTDIRINPLLANQLASVLLRILEVGLSGVYHVGSEDTVSKYDFGVSLAKAFALDSSLIRPVGVDTGRLRAARPRNLSLESEKVERALGLKLPTTQAGIEDLRALEQEGYRDRVSDLLFEPAQS